MLTPNTFGLTQNSNLKGVNTLATARKKQSVDTLNLHDQKPLKLLTPNTLAAASFFFNNTLKINKQKPSKVLTPNTLAADSLMF